MDDGGDGREAAGPDDGSDPPGLSQETRRALEAIIMVAADPVPPQMLAQLLEVAVERVEQECAELAAGYRAEGRGFVLVRVAGGYRYQSHPDAAPYVERYVLEGQSARLSNAALETLAIVAYKQPLSRAQVASIRGVNVDGVMRTLVHRGLVTEVARDPGPGQALLYGTTPLFLERLGVDSVGDLPPIAAFVPGADVVEALEQGLRLDDAGPATAEEAAEEPADEDPGAVAPAHVAAASDPPAKGVASPEGSEHIDIVDLRPAGLDPDDVGPEDLGPAGVDREDVGPEDLSPAGVDPEDVGPEDLGPEEVGPEDVGPGAAPGDVAAPDDDDGHAGRG
jgi:segregation and condensation protein B